MAIYKSDRGVELLIYYREESRLARGYELGPLTVQPRCLLEAVLE